MHHKLVKSNVLQDAFPAVLGSKTEADSIVSYMNAGKEHRIHELPFGAEAFYEAAQRLSRRKKAMALQQALVKGYFYAGFEIAEHIFKQKEDFHLYNSPKSEIAKYEIFTYQAEKFLKQEMTEDNLAQKTETALPEAYFKLALIYGQQGKRLESLHNLTQAAQLGHMQAKQVLQATKQNT
ncbi:MAG: hypothetical protein CMF60_02760 [Magnetococcales bacterium]|nr:hypothetical protein [Magnetococcales bacterium]MEC8066482.1 hypothetical protein [Pseudomonadota bacterium]|tara:strand:- start:2406 stop:2945 length:540 start_codon:yes stop_codon:yes gene_type:complete